MAIKARIKSTGETIEGFLDGNGHFDVPVDHCEFERYDVNDLEIKVPFGKGEEYMNGYDQAFKDITERLRKMYKAVPEETQKLLMEHFWDMIE